MSQELVVNLNFWSNPPWSDGKGKYRLGLKPIEIEKWFEAEIDEELKQHKEKLFENSYESVVRVTKDSMEAQKLLTQHIASNNEYRDPPEEMITRDTRAIFQQENSEGRRIFFATSRNG